MIVPLLILAWAPRKELSLEYNLAPVYLFVLHYALRTFVMGFLTRGGKPMPLTIMLQVRRCTRVSSAGVLKRRNTCTRTWHRVHCFAPSTV